MNTSLFARFFVLLPLLVAWGIKSWPNKPVTYTTKTFTVENGLPNNFVQNITQDQTGFLWIATWDGLSRYDGYEFKNFYHKPDDKTSFPFFVVDKLIADDRNNLWILCQFRTVVKYDRGKNQFKNFYPTLRDSAITDMTPGIDNDIWFISTDHLYRYKIDDNRLSAYRFRNGRNQDKITLDFLPQLILDNTGKIWVFLWENSGYQLFRCNPEGDSIAHLREIKPLSFKQFNLELHNNTTVFQIYTSKQGNTWLFSRYGLYLFDPVSEQFNKNIAPVNPEEFSGKPYFLWIDEKTGIHIIDTKSKNAFAINMDPEKYAETAFVDRSGIIWGGDISESRQNIGLKRYIKTPTYFKNFLTERVGSNKSGIVNSILKDKNGLIWVGIKNAGDIFRFRPDKTFDRIKIAPSYQGENRPHISSIIQDSAGIWLGCRGNVLMNYDYLSNGFSYRHFTSADLGNDSVILETHNILKDRSDLIINGAKGVYRYNTKNKMLSRGYVYPQYAPCFTMVKDRNDGYWVGMNNNTIHKLDRNLNETASYRFGNGINNTEHICPGTNNDIWVAFMGGGIGHLYLDSGKKEILTTADGLGSNTCYSLLMDKNDNLWISTISGISRYNTRTRQFRNFTKDDGLKIDEFNSDASFQAPDGEMFFGGVGGFVSFYPDSIMDNRETGNPAPLVITELKVSGIPKYFDKAVYDLDSLSLEQGDNNFQVNFSCLDFKNAEKIKYRYRLSGENDEWVETDHQHRSVNYANLAPGDYKLEVQATNPDGQWVSATSLMIHIPYYLYQTGWFRALALLVAAALITAIIGLYIRQIRLKSRQREGELRLESLRGQMNPHFIFNSLNSINYFISRSDKLMANMYIADFSRLIRSFLNNLSVDYISLGKEIESVRDYLKLEHLRFADKFNYTLDAETVENQDQIQVFPGMVQPFIENAVWHGVRGLEDRAGSISVVFTPGEGDSVRCVVEDDGVGRKLSELFKTELPGKKSRGIGIVIERLKVINNLKRTNYQVVIEDCFPGRDETGTRVIINIPAKYQVG